MAFRNHSVTEIRGIESRIRSVADMLGKIADEMAELECVSLKLQSDSVMNHKFTPVEDWSVKVQVEAEKQLRKIRRDKEAFTASQQYAAAKAEKPVKKPKKSRQSGKTPSTKGGTSTPPARTGKFSGTATKTKFSLA